MGNGCNYFLQFTTKLTNEGYGNCYSLANGFSDTYTLCKSIGEFVWIDQSNYSNKSREDTINDFNSKINEFPIKEGTVYVSAFQIFHVYQVCKWAQQFKHVKFIVGGSAIDSGFLNFQDIVFPDNVIITDKSVESFLGVEDFSHEWGIDIPNEIVKDDNLFFTYSIDNSCYWGKCIFCKFPQQSNKSRERSQFDFTFKNIKPGVKKCVWLHSPSFTPEKIKSVFPKLPNQDDLEYIVFMRGNNAERNALEEIYNSCDFDFSKMKFYMGIEFPSNRMLKWMNKGVTVNELSEFLNLTHKLKAKTIISYILGWNNLIQDDITEVKEFMESLPKNDLNFQKVFTLAVTKNTEMYNRFYDKETLVPVNCGPFNVCYIMDIDNQQKFLNQKARDIIINNGFETFDTYKERG